MAKAKDFTQNKNGLTSLQTEAFNTFGGTPPDNEELRRNRKERIEQINIFEVAHDLTQPRRAIPSEVRAEWDGKNSSLTTFFQAWLDWVGTWKSLVIAILEGNEVELPDNADPRVAALIDLAGLAGSISRDGLMNPVTLAKIAPDQYLLESGERRWLAYHLLYAHTEDEKWLHITARLVENVNRWRQAAENNARADLNAIGRARQFAVLLMDLLVAKGIEFAAFDTFANEQEFYAQVAEFDVPYGKSQLLLGAMGVKHRNAVQRYRDLLTLPPDLWIKADDTNCPEGALRDLVKLPYDEAWAKFEQWQNVTNGDNSDSPTPPTQTPTPTQIPGKKVFFFPENRIKAMRRVMGLDQASLAVADPKLDAKRLKDIQEARAALDELEQFIKARQ